MTNMSLETRNELRAARIEIAESDWLEWLYRAESSVCNHVWRVDSYLGHDTGYEGFTCKRCGSTHSFAWY
jgi:hypothetical protein